MMPKIGDEINDGVSAQTDNNISTILSRLVSLSSTSDIERRTSMRPGSLLQKLWIRPIFWAISDAILINVGFAIAYYIRYELQWIRTVEPANYVSFVAFVPFIITLTVLLLLVFRNKNIYKSQRNISWFDEFSRISNGTALGILLMIVFVFFYQPTFYSRIIFLYAGALILLLLGISRAIKVALLRYWRKTGFGVVRLMIVGAGEVARTVMRAVVANPEDGYEIVGFVDDDLSKGQTDIGRFRALGSINNLDELLGKGKVDEVIVTLPWQYHRKIMSINTLCERHGIALKIVPDVFQMTLSQVEMDEMAGVPLLGMKHISISGSNLVLKRVIDFTVALLGLLLLSPIMGLIALAIKLDSPGAAIFSQERVGREGKRFQVYKFRSMVNDAEAQKSALLNLNEADGPIFKIKDDPRMTRLGGFLRRFSLDELPQLYNVLLGDMSLVGPRPNIPAEVAQYQSWHHRRLEVVPGITGLWQVSGRSDLTFDEMALLDIYYLENWSLALDIKIFLQTIPTVLLRVGAY